MSAVASEVDEQELASARWFEYFASIARCAEGVLASVEVLRAEDSACRAVKRPLHTISYDAQVGVLELVVGGRSMDAPVLRYFIQTPQTICVAEWARAKQIRVRDAAGETTVITLFGVSQLRSRAVRVAGSSSRLRCSRQ